MTRLILLNGLPGVGKSTLARRWADAHPGTLVCDIDLLRTWVGGWRSSFVEVGAAIRPAAQGLIAGYLRAGDVVLPQLIANAAELDAFADVAGGAGASFCHVVLRAPAGSSAGARFRRRSGDDPWHGEVQRLVAEAGGDALLADYGHRLAVLVDTRPALVVESVEGDEEGTYAALHEALSASSTAQPPAG